MTVAELIESLKKAPQDKIVRVCSNSGRVAEAEIVAWTNAVGPLMEPGVRIEVGFGPKPEMGEDGIR